jgi:hypothetical protein
MSTIFQGWVPHTDGFGYTGEANTLTYSGRWRAPYTTDTLVKARELIDPKKRFAAAAAGSSTYDFKTQIEHSLIPYLTAQRMSLRPLNGFAPNVMDSVTGNSADGLWSGNSTASNTLQNAEYCVVDVEWMLKPVNSFGINCSYVSVNGAGEFQEMGSDRTGYCIQDTRTGTGLPLDTPGRGGISVITACTPANVSSWSNSTQYLQLYPLSKGQTLIEPKDTVTIEYPWVDASLVNLTLMRSLRGKINLHDTVQWPAGSLLYEGSDVESAISPLGNLGYKITHHFTAKDRDWNLIPITPSATANTTSNITWKQTTYGWATFKPPMATSNGSYTPGQPAGLYPNLTLTNNYDSYLNRVYQYADFWTSAAGTLFYYGFDPAAAAASPAVNPY